MAQKFFIATCEKKVSKHPVKDGVKLILPVTAATQTDAKNLVREEVETLDPAFDNSDKTYNDWYKVPQLEKVTEEEFNKAVIANEPASETKEEQLEIPEKKFPTLENDGFFDSKHKDVEESSFVYSNDPENFQAAKVFILQVGYQEFSYGFRYMCQDVDKHEKMNLDRVTSDREDAIEKGIERLSKFLDYQDEYGSGSHEPFLSAAINHDFYQAFMEPSELFAEAVANHPNFEKSQEENPNFLEDMESHFASIWPLKQSPDLAIEHLNSMANIDVLSDLSVFTEAFKQYLPSTVPEHGFQKANETMKRIEKALNDQESASSPKCWRAALTITDDFHVVLSITDFGDEGWRYSFEGNNKSERAFGDVEQFEGEFVTTREEAIKLASHGVIQHLYLYDSSLALGKAFSKTDYIQDFEENCMEMGASFEQESDEELEHKSVLEAIKHRLERRSAETKSQEVQICYDAISKHINQNTSKEMLLQEIGSCEHCSTLFNEELAKELVIRCTNNPNEIKSEDITHNPENEHECFIAEILSRVGDEGAAILTAEQYEEAGDKLSLAIEEFTELHGEKLNLPVTLNNIAETDWDSPNEVAKTFLNIRSLRATLRDCVELFEEEQDSESNAEDKRIVNRADVGKYPALLQAIAKRLFNENHAVKPERAYNQMLKVIKGIEDLGHTINIEGLRDAILELKNPVIIWHSTESVNLIMKFATEVKPDGKQKQEDTGEVVNNEPENTEDQENLTTANASPKSDDNGSTSDSDGLDSDSDIPSDILNQEAANEPAHVPSVKLDLENPNMSIWNAAFKTDLDFTKQDPSTGRLSINSQYRQQEATRIFGSRGKGWGVDIKREWIEEGMPIFVNGNYMNINESVHNIEIELWYIHPDSGDKCTVTAYGETERWYWSYNNGRLVKNSDFRKKSLTDATGKALSMLGICGDVYMGEYDDDRIISRSQATKMTSDNIKTMEFDAQTAQAALDKAKSYTDKFKKAPSLAEIKRLQKLAETSLEAFPVKDNESKGKKEKALSRIKEQAQEAINQFNLDKEQQANG